MQISVTAFAELLANAKGVMVFSIRKPWKLEPKDTPVHYTLHHSEIGWGSVEYDGSSKYSHFFRFYEYDKDMTTVDCGSIVFPKQESEYNSYHLFATDYGLFLQMETANKTFISGYEYTTFLLNDNERTPV